MRGSLLCIAFAASVLTGCREGVPPFELPITPPGQPPLQITFGFGQDSDPRWSPDGDSLLYHTSHFNTLPQVRGVLLTIAPSGGTATPVIEDVQRVGTKLLATPAYSPDGTRLAYVDLVSVLTPVPCTPNEGEREPLCPWSQPLLDSAWLRVRNIGETRDHTLDPRVVISFEGTLDENPNFQRAFPFQVEHRLTHSMLFRPSWAPDGERIAYSDGLAIRVWRVGDAHGTVVPGTVDGVSPAWSPDGQWIAFTQLERGDSTTIFCGCAPFVTHRRVLYSVVARRLVLIRPDGSERTDLGAGEDPAWSPDGTSIYVRRNDQIVRVSPQGGAATPIAGTTNGRAPAVSPDGRWLALARRKPQQIVDYDIWVVPLQ